MALVTKLQWKDKMTFFSIVLEKVKTLVRKELIVAKYTVIS